MGDRPCAQASEHPTDSTQLRLQPYRGPPGPVRRVAANGAGPGTVWDTGPLVPSFLRSVCVSAAVAAIGALGAAAGAHAAVPTPLPALKLVPVGAFFQPVYVAAPPADRHRIFVVQKSGSIRVVVDGRRLATPFLNLRPLVDSVGEERGMLSMAFAPDYARSKRFYVAYTAKNGDVTLDEFQRRADDHNRADRTTRRNVVTQRHTFNNHNSGQLQFGPDGMLYMGLGDGGGSGDRAGNAQNLRRRLGKILRLDPRGATLAPSNNPFVGVRHANPEVYAYGFRNPWRFSFDRLTGAMAIADVGQDTVEEVNFLQRGKAAGRNFGWNRCEGAQAFPITTAPATRCALAKAVRPGIQLQHEAGFCAVIGGYVVRDRSLGAYYGRYLYSDWCNGMLRSANPRGGDVTRDDRASTTAFVAPTSFGQDAGGCLYATSITGVVARITVPVLRAKVRAGAPGTIGCMPLAVRT